MLLSKKEDGLCCGIKSRWHIYYTSVVILYYLNNNLTPAAYAHASALISEERARQNIRIERVPATATRETTLRESFITSNTDIQRYFEASRGRGSGAGEETFRVYAYNSNCWNCVLRANSSK